VVDTISFSALSQGTNSFTWDGVDNNGTPFEPGEYTMEISYKDSAGNAKTTQYGVYPVEAVRFENGEALLKLGSQYIPLSNIKEIYNPES
jgi:flagellar basal-body rod modification protein FlgD